MSRSNNINVFWWSSVKFEGKSQENFGDILSKYLVEKISGRKVVWKNPNKLRWNLFKKKVYTTTGSILKHITKDCIVWGSGIISKEDHVSEAEFLAVRGPETYNYLIDKGYKVNKVFGDPAIVLPDLYKTKTKKVYALGIIPHYVDYLKITGWYQDNKDVKIINLLNNNIEEVIDEIASCKQIISSSLHGVIVSHTYNIPAVWVKFSEKLSGDNIKFADYFKSVNLQPYKAELVNNKLEIAQLEQQLEQYPSLPEEGVIKDLSVKLMKVCPFKH